MKTHLAFLENVRNLRSKSVLILAASTLPPSWGFAQSAPSSIDEAIRDLEKPSMEAAKSAVAKLSQYAKTQAGEEKSEAELVGNVIKDIFTDDYSVNKALEGVQQAEVEATKEENRAADWLTPNAFGRINEVAANDSIRKAKEIREAAAAKLDDARMQLANSMRAGDAALKKFYDAGQIDRLIVVYGVLDAINQRAYAKNPAPLSINRRTIDALIEFRANSPLWIADAKSAENAGDFEKAARLFSKAKDIEGQKRCAGKLAETLEKRGLHGSAIEYYEIAGDFVRAKTLRDAHPELLSDAFTTMQPEDIYAKVSPSCVRIVSQTNKSKGHGSGFFFQSGGYILTNNHVVEGASSLTVKLDDERSYEGRVLASSDTPDLAVVKIDLDEHSSIRFSNADTVKIGSSVVLVGYPIDDSIATATMNTGRISNTDRVFEGNPCYQLDVSANHGNSGGPVVDSTGRLVGILTFGLGDLDIDRFNFAIRVDVIRDFLANNLATEYADK